MLDQILIVDDDNIYRSELVEAFSDEYDILEAASGDAALELLKKPNNISLIMLDICMPGLNGVDVLRRIKKSDPAIKVIIITGHGAKDVVVKCLKEHADDFVEKMQHIDIIKKTIEKQLGLHKGKQELGELDIKGKLEIAKNFVERNWSKKVDLASVAGLIHVSPKYLSRVCKEFWGVSFNDFRLAEKVKRSKEFLKKTGMNVDQIAEKLGYLNTESYIRTFKKITKMTPAAYRKKMQKSG